MTFDPITEDGHVRAVRFDNEDENELFKLFEQWNDILYLREQFMENLKGLRYYNISVDDAIRKTRRSSHDLEESLLSINSNTDLDKLFRPLTDKEPTLLEKNKARLHPAKWLRLYALRLEPGVYIITGGGIKLAETMQEAHIDEELVKLEKCRNFLIEKSVYDKNSFQDYILEN